MIVSFFGCSAFSKSEAYYEEVMKILEEKIGDNSVEFYLGGKGGFDSFAFDCCLDYKRKHKSAKVNYVSPYPSILLCERGTLSAYDEIIVPDVIMTCPPKFGYLKRNAWMVEQSDLIIFYVPHHATGAARVIKIAARSKKEYINLAKDFEL